MNNYTGYERLQIDGGKHLSVEHHMVFLEHPLHWHNYFELEMIPSGAGKYIINDVEYDLSKKNFFFLTPTDFYSLSLKADKHLLRRGGGRRDGHRIPSLLENAESVLI